MKRRISIILNLLMTLPVLMQVSFAKDFKYLLGPQDQLQIRVSDLRPGTGEAYQWQAFNIPFTVGPMGRLSLPIIGEIVADGKSTADIEAMIAEKLQSKAGLAAKPDASVQIIKYRPFYIMGNVEKPGEYEFRPNLSVIQAISIAGGLRRVNADLISGYTRSAVTSKGDVEELMLRRLALLARQARLTSEVQNTPLQFPAELLSQSKNSSIARLMSDEKLASDNNRSGLQNRLENLNQSKVFLQEQITSLTSKEAALARQLEVLKQEFERISTLVSKGLSALPRQVDVSQTMVQMESNRLDAQIGIIRARQDLAKADRDMIELKETRRNSALQEVLEVQSKLGEGSIKSNTAAKLLLQSNALLDADSYSNDNSRQQRYSLVRMANGKQAVLEVQENDAVEPGDVLKVFSKEVEASSMKKITTADDIE